MYIWKYGPDVEAIGLANLKFTIAPTGSNLEK